MFGSRLGAVSQVCFLAAFLHTRLGLGASGADKFAVDVLLDVGVVMEDCLAVVADHILHFSFAAHPLHFAEAKPKHLHHMDWEEDVSVADFSRGRLFGYHPFQHFKEYLDYRPRKLGECTHVVVVDFVCIHFRVVLDFVSFVMQSSE